MRRPGCNGGVCYCNKEDYCNDKKSVSRETIVTRVILRCDVQRYKKSDPCPQEMQHSKWDQRCREEIKE